ncbi:MAG: hypothetical protein P9L99_18575 [Candidatus Lernaella stagnicola]|nr:hypothetical protein [Candidatus Lernaella stagnicola]
MPEEQTQQRRLPWARGDALALGLLAALVLAFFWPMLRDPAGTFVGVFGNKGDVEGTLWWNWWVNTALLDGDLSLWQTATLFFPVGTAVAPFYGSVLNVLFYLPWMRLLPLPLSNNLWCLLIALIDVAVAYFVFRDLTGRRLPALAGAVLWALAPFKFLEFRDGHLPQILLTFIPLAAWALWRLRETPGRTLALVAGAFLMLDGCGYYQHLYGAFFLAAGIGLSGLWRYRRDPPARRAYLKWQALVAAIVAVGAVVFYYPLIASVLAGLDAPWEWATRFPPTSQLQQSASHILILTLGSLRVQLGGDPAIKIEAAFLLALAVASIVLGLRRRHALVWLLLGVFFALLAIGPIPSIRSFDPVQGWHGLTWRNPVYILLFNYFPSFNRLYWPDTFWPYAVFALAMTATLALAELPRRAMAIGSAAMILLGLAFSTAFVVRQPHVGAFVDREALSAMAASDGKAFFPLPTPAGDDYCLPAVVLTGRAMVGGRARDLGYLEPTEFARIAYESQWLRALQKWSQMEDYPPPGLEVLESWKKSGANHVVLHRPTCHAWDEKQKWSRNVVGLEKFLRERLDALLGPPLASDDTWVVYSLP